MPDQGTDSLSKLDDFLQGLPRVVPGLQVGHEHRVHRLELDEGGDERKSSRFCRKRPTNSARQSIGTCPRIGSSNGIPRVSRRMNALPCRSVSAPEFTRRRTIHGPSSDHVLRDLSHHVHFARRKMTIGLKQAPGHAPLERAPEMSRDVCRSLSAVAGKCGSVRSFGMRLSVVRNRRVRNDSLSDTEPYATTFRDHVQSTHGLATAIRLPALAVGHLNRHVKLDVGRQRPVLTGIVWVTDWLRMSGTRADDTHDMPRGSRSRWSTPATSGRGRLGGADHLDLRWGFRPESRRVGISERLRMPRPCRSCRDP